MAGNWKMNLNHQEAVVLVQKLAWTLSDKRHDYGLVDVVVVPPFTDIRSVQTLVDGDRLAIRYGAQDLSPYDAGAHTGDVSGPQLADAGCTWVLCGHSERRQDHGEDDALVARKVAAALRNGLAPLVCVGETREERQAGRTFGVLERQLRSAIVPVADAPGPFAVAYEPVWAIGTGETATPETAQEVHAFLRLLLGELVEGVAAALPILYGGSATPENAAGLIAQPDVDGFLVGGASLDPQKFLAIIRHSG